MNHHHHYTTLDHVLFTSAVITGILYFIGVALRPTGDLRLALPSALDRYYRAGYAFLASAAVFILLILADVWSH